MNKQEFIALAVSSGYGNPKAAKHYTELHPKQTYDTEDFVALYQTSMRWEGCGSDKGLRSVYGMNAGCKTTAINHIEGNSGSGQDWRI